MARPVKLNGTLIKKVCENILTGATYQASAVAAGISYDTFNEYRKGAKAALEKKAEKRSELDNLLIEFSEAVERANAELQISLLKGIKTKGKRDWKALAWIAQNRFPSDFSERKTLDVNNIEWDPEKWKAERNKRLKAVKALEE
jgi:hypothetical protein